MKAKRWLQLIVVLVVMVSCTKKAEEFNSKFELFKKYILNFSSGLVSAKSDIRVVLAFENQNWKTNQELDDDLFTISPSVDGKVVALSNNTIAFIPEKKLKQNTEYQITFHLSELKDTPKELDDFNFTIKTKKQDFTINPTDLQSYSKEYQYLNGTIVCSDDVDLDNISKVIKAKQKDSDLKVKVLKSSKATNIFNFVIDSIQRKVEDEVIEITWDGNDQGIDQKGSMDYVIPGKNNFKIVAAEVQQEDSQVLVVNFSDPLSREQDFEGLVQVEGAGNLKFATAGNLLKVYFEQSLKGELQLEVFQGIQSEDGYKMKENFTQKVTFEQTKPGVRFIKSGTIMPSSSNLKLNFEAVNLNAVDIKVYQIYKNKLLYRFQSITIQNHKLFHQTVHPLIPHI